MKALLIIILILSFGCAKSIKERPEVSQLVFDQEADSELGFSLQIQLNKQLIQAIVTSASPLVRSAIQRGADPNEVQIDGETALTYSIKNKLDSILYILLQENADPNKMNTLNETPIHLSIDYNDPIAARMLLNKENLLINIFNNSHETPVINALKSNNKRIALMLINNGADLSIKSSDGETTDQVAYRVFDSNFSNLLVKLEQFANIETRTQTLLDIVTQNDTTTLKYIKKIHQNSSIHYSLDEYREIFKHDNKKIIEVALQTMLATSQYSSYLEHMIAIEAIKTDDVEIFRIVYRNLTKPNINLVDNLKRTLLTYAAERSNYTMSLNLRKLGANTYIKVNEDLVINSCDYLSRKRQSRRRYRAFKEMLGC